jgi:hypothetical protein
MTTVPAANRATAFYLAALPLVEWLASMATAWRDADPLDEDALTAYRDFVALAIRCRLRLREQGGTL